MVTQGLGDAGLGDAGLGDDGLLLKGSSGSDSMAGAEPAELLRRAAAWRLDAACGRETVSSGFPTLDRLLPAGGVRRGSLVEWLAADDAAGAVSLACAVACWVAGQRSAGRAPASPSTAARAATIVVVDRGQRLYPPAVMPWLESHADATVCAGRRPQLVVARPSRDDDEIWTIDQALRCSGVAAVLAWPGRVHATAMRRWQLAARASGAVGLLVRGLSGRQHPGEPTWADARVAVTPVVEEAPGADSAARRLRLARVGGAWSGEEMLVEKSVELLLDLAHGREAACRHRAAGRSGPHAPVVAAAVRQAEGVACRAS